MRCSSMSSLFCVIAVLVVIILQAAGTVQGARQKSPYDAAITHYKMLDPIKRTNQEKAICESRGRCLYQILTCPKECPERKPKNYSKQKACYINCSACEATCKRREPNCDGYGSLCYDPRFVGGDGVMFYFHGSKEKDFAIVSDTNLQINAHLIGTRPQGRTRDFTWVQALAIMFDTHALTIAAKRVSHWDNSIDSLIVMYDGEYITIPTNGDSEWRNNGDEKREVVVERTSYVNAVKATVAGLLELNVRVRPIGKEENRVHRYQLPEDDAFAHLEIQFKFVNLSDLVEGILGKTYRPGYVSPVKRGVPMPVMGGEREYLTPSLYKPFCQVCRFTRPEESREGDDDDNQHQYIEDASI